MQGGLLGVPREQQRGAGRAGGLPLGVPPEEQRVVTPGGRLARHSPGGAADGAECPRSGPPRPPGQSVLELGLSGCCASGAFSIHSTENLLGPCICVAGGDEGPGGCGSPRPPRPSPGGCPPPPPPPLPCRRPPSRPARRTPRPRRPPRCPPPGMEPPLEDAGPPGGMPSSSSSSSLPRLRLPSNDASSCSAERASCSAALVRCTSPSSDKFTATERLTENFLPPERRRRRSRRTESPLSSEANNTRRLHRSRPMPMRAVSGGQWISASGRSKDVLMLT